MNVASRASIVSSVNANERLKARVRKFIDMGVNQKVLAGAMGVRPSTFNKWLSGKSDWVPPLTAPELWEEYEAKWRDLVTKGEETQREAADASTAGGLQRSVGKPNTSPH